MSTQDFYKEIDEIIEKEVVNRHSLFQLKYFVVLKEPTTQARLHICLRELASRRESMKAAELEIEELQDNKALLALEIEGWRRQSDPSGKFGIEDENADLKEEERKIQIRKLERKERSINKTIGSLEKKLREAGEEANFFAEAYQTLEKVEPLKPFDDPHAQIEFWNEKLSQEVQLRLLLRKPLDLEMIKTILCLDDQMPIKQETVKMLELVQTKATKERQLAEKEPKTETEQEKNV